ncbi:MAG TPA: hypothetical protein G4N96_12265 [Chloroflexi bacterium]|nr:hypothetical protein [Chloroflexota bacterium]
MAYQRVAFGYIFSKVQSVKGGSVIVGGAKTPYGYDIEIVDGKRQLAVNEDEAATIRLIFDLYTRQGKTIYGVKQYLDAHSISKKQKGNLNKARVQQTASRLKAAKKPSDWIAASISKVLGNETYAGRWHYRKTKRIKNPKTGKYKQIPRPRSEWMMIEVPAIVDEATFAEAQRLKNANKRIRKSKSRRTYFLGGMMRCAYCGQSVTGVAVKKGGKEYRYYKCAAFHTMQRYKTKCTESKSHHTRKIDTLVWNWLKDILLDPSTLQRSLDEYQEAQEDVQNPILRMIEASESKLTDLETQLKRLIDAYSAGVLSLADLAKSKADLDKQITDTRKAIEALQADLDPETLTEDDIELIHQFAAAFRENVNLIDADLEARREIAKLLQVKVVMARDYVDISCVLGKTISNVPFDTPRAFCYHAALPETDRKSTMEPQCK